MSKLLFTVVIVYFSFTAQAHPSWGIVSSSTGQIYFVDVMHNGGTLWNFDPITHEFTILVTGDFHAHTLQIDSEDKLYIGVQIWKQDEIMGDGHNYFFCYDTRNDELDTLLFTEDYKIFNGGNSAYLYDENVLLYSKDHQLNRASFDGSNSTIFDGHHFERLSTMAVGPDQSLWIADSYYESGSLLQWKNEKMTVYRSNLIPRNPENPAFEERSHQLIYGIGFSLDGAPIITQSASRKVEILHFDGTSETLYHSPNHYFPVGVCYLNDDLYIMEVGYVPGKGNVGPGIVEIKDGVTRTFTTP